MVKGQPEQSAKPSGVSQAILERLDRLEKQNNELLEQIRSLRQLITEQEAARPGTSAEAPGMSPSESSKESAAQPTAAAVTATPTLRERQEVSEHRIEELAQTKLESSQRYPIQLTGMGLFNAFSNGRFGGSAQDPVVAALDSSPVSAGGTLRQTVLGLTFQSPRALWGGSVSGSLYMDFFGGSSQSLNHLLRLRVATIQVNWAHTTFALGQDKPLVSRREPNSLAQVGVSPLTAAGNPWLWQPQARVEQRFDLSNKTSVRAEAGVFQTSEANGQPSYIVSEIQGARPALEGRIALRHNFSDERVIEVAPVFHTSTSHVGGVAVPSRLFGADLLIKPSSKFEITGLAFSGKNFANLGALGGITAVDPERPIPVRGEGGWAQLRIMPTQKLSFDFYGGQQDDRNRDLEAGSIAKNQYYAGNVMYLIAPNVMTSFELGHVRTTYLGIGTRTNNHYDLALAYLF